MGKLSKGNYPLCSLSLCLRAHQGALHGVLAERPAEVHAGYLPASLPGQQARYPVRALANAGGGCLTCR